MNVNVLPHEQMPILTKETWILKFSKIDLTHEKIYVQSCSSGQLTSNSEKDLQYKNHDISIC